MTTCFGWCFGPEGSTGDHDSCPYELGADGAILRCGCACHEGSEKSGIFNQARGNDVSAWDNSREQTSPDCVLGGPQAGALADCKESTNG